MNSSTCSRTGTTSVYSSPIVKQSESTECSNYYNLKQNKKATREYFGDVQQYITPFDSSDSDNAELKFLPSDLLSGDDEILDQSIDKEISDNKTLQITPIKEFKEAAYRMVNTRVS